MAKKYNEVPVKNNMVMDDVDTDVIAEGIVKDKKELKKILDAQPKKRKRSLVGRLVSGVLGPEGLPGIGSYVNDEIILPAIKNIIVDAVTSGINMVMYGENKPRSGGGRHSSYSRDRSGYRPNTNYQGRYSGSQQPPAQAPDPRVRPAKHGVEEYIIEERFDASHVLTALTEQADRYDVVSVADYYELIGVPSEYTDNTYGWTIDSIHHASIVPIRGGYVLKFPPVEVI